MIKSVLAKPSSVIILLLTIIAVFTWRNHAVIHGMYTNFQSFSAEHGGDTNMYIQGADAMLSGDSITNKQNSYLNYIAILSVIKYAGLKDDWILLVHLLGNILAVGAIYKLGHWLGGPLTGVIAAFIYVENPDIATWNRFILSDSIYISSVVLAVYGVYAAHTKKGAWYLVAILTVMIAVLTKPNGWIIAPISLTWWVMFSSRSVQAKLGYTALILFTFISAMAVIPAFSKDIEGREPVEMLTQGKVVWGNDDWQMKMPHEPGLKGSKWSKAIKYITKHPFACAKLAAYRVFACFAHVRSQYADRQNWHYVIMLTVIYSLAVIGLIAKGREPLSVLMIMVAVGHIFTVAITYADTDGRFLLYFLPLIIVFSGQGASSILNKYFNIFSIKRYQGSQ